MVRYDPTNPEHSKYILQQEPLKEKITKKRKHTDLVSENQEVERPTVSKETFYEVKENFTETLKEDKPFSLLNLFGKAIKKIINCEVFFLLNELLLNFR